MNEVADRRDDPMARAVKGTSSVVAQTARGKRTRKAVLEAAKRVFEEVGFPDARVEQIASQAGVSYGTFYRYFESKEEVFYELSTRLFELFHRQTPEPGDLAPAARIVAANRAYYRAYRRNARMIFIIEQVATISAEFREVRHEHRRILIGRIASAIARWQQRGDVRSDLDSEIAARAMCAMVDRSLYLANIQWDDIDEARLLDNLNRMCLGALGLEG